MVRFQLSPPRLFLCRRRVHHGLIALLWLLTDVKDYRRWFPDFLRHPDAR